MVALDTPFQIVNAADLAGRPLIESGGACVVSPGPGRTTLALGGGKPELVGASVEHKVHFDSG